MEPSLLVWDRVRQLRRVSLRSSQDRSVAIAVQRGGAMAYLEGHYKALHALGRQSEAGVEEVEEVQAEEEKTQEEWVRGREAHSVRVEIGPLWRCLTVFVFLPSCLLLSVVL